MCIIINIVGFLLVYMTVEITPVIVSLPSTFILVLQLQYTHDDAISVSDWGLEEEWRDKGKGGSLGGKGVSCCNLSCCLHSCFTHASTDAGWFQKRMCGTVAEAYIVIIIHKPPISTTVVTEVHLNDSLNLSLLFISPLYATGWPRQTLKLVKVINWWPLITNTAIRSKLTVTHIKITITDSFIFKWL